MTGSLLGFNLWILSWEPGNQGQLCLGRLVTWAAPPTEALCELEKSEFLKGPPDLGSGSGNASTCFR